MNSQITFISRQPRPSAPLRRGAAVVGMLVAMLVMAMIMVGLVMGGARDQDLTVQRMNTVRSFYAAEAGMNMAIRETMAQNDYDGDGGIGSISNDDNSSNDPALGLARVFVTASSNANQRTLVATATENIATRKASTTMITENSSFGNTDTPPNWSMWNVRNKQIASPVTMPASGTLTSISIVIWGASAQYVRLAIYSDGGGKPGSLIVQSASEEIGNEHGLWRTLSVPPTLLAPGTYWLAIATNSNSVSYYFASPGTAHVLDYNAVGNGFCDPWGTTDSTRSENVALMGTYTPADTADATFAVMGWEEIP